MDIPPPVWKWQAIGKNGVGQSNEWIESFLPPATIIASPGKMPAIISLSCAGICGEEDFRSRREKEARTSGGNEGNFSD